MVGFRVQSLTCVRIFCLLYLLSEAHASQFSVVGNLSITAIPYENIPQDVTLIEVKNCAVEDFDFFPAFPSLQSLYLQFNRLTVFPDLSNASDTLQNLFLPYNNITHIDVVRLQSLPNLRRLQLTENPYLQYFPDGELFSATLDTLELFGTSLLEFPDLPGYGRTLRILTISKAHFTSIPVSRLKQLSVLRILTLMDIPLVEFPDISVINSSLLYLNVEDTEISEIPEAFISGNSLQSFSVSNNPHLLETADLSKAVKTSGSLHMRMLTPMCDCRMLWLADARMVGTVNIVTTGSHCSTPVKLAGVSLDLLTHGDLYCGPGK